jgi:hypothetical protein
MLGYDGNGTPVVLPENRMVQVYSSGHWYVYWPDRSRLSSTRVPERPRLGPSRTQVTGSTDSASAVTTS